MINRLQFSIEIDAEKAEIWETLWNEDAYRNWASVFYEGSYAVSDDWKEGSQVQFLIPDKSGIYSRIEKHIPNEIMHFKHIGSVVDGQPQALDDETKKWSGTTEVYTLTETENGHKLTVDIDILDEHLEYMTKTFPKALERIKTNCG